MYSPEDPLSKSHMERIKAVIPPPSPRQMWSHVDQQSESSVMILYAVRINASFPPPNEIKTSILPALSLKKNF